MKPSAAESGWGGGRLSSDGSVGATAMAGEKKTEFWRWTESNWKNPDLDWRKAEFITVGIDVGSVSSQAVLAADGQILGYGNMRTGSDSPNSARHALAFALEPVEHAGGAHRLLHRHGLRPRQRALCRPHHHRDRLPRPRGELHLRPRGAHRAGRRRTGHQVHPVRRQGQGDQLPDERQVRRRHGPRHGGFRDLLGVPITEAGERSFEFKGQEPAAVSSTCVVFAKSEAAGLLRKGWTREEVLAAYCSAMADRILSLVKRVGVEPGFAVTGGMAKNRGVMDRLMRKIGLERMRTAWDTQIAGAAGAALYAYALCLKGDGK
ncbi:MAG: hypothetical protein MZV70_12070 [Desulfobacterales bacterium]|nr:hypothetical protein [Desulfobacterales bacterium]